MKLFHTSEWQWQGNIGSCKWVFSRVIFRHLLTRASSTFKQNGAIYISEFITLRITNYNLRNNWFKVNQPSYNKYYNLLEDETNSLVIFKKKFHNTVLSKAVCMHVYILQILVCIIILILTLLHYKYR